MVTSKASLAAWVLFVYIKTDDISPKNIMKNGKEVPAVIAAKVPINIISLSFLSPYFNKAKKETIFVGS
jgi:hypothetical protein